MTVTADVVCPFSYLGCSRLFEALTLEAIAPADLVWSFEPVLAKRASAPTGDAGARYGDPSVLRRRVERLATRGGAAARTDVSSQRAHVLLTRFPDPQLLRLLFEAHFENGRDISSMGELIDVAAMREIPRAAVIELLEDPELGADLRARAARYADMQTPRIRVSGSPPFVGVHTVDAYRRALAHGRRA